MKDKKIKENDDDCISVKAFADATGRFTNNIYDLINHGNAYGKLKTIVIDGKIKVLKSELNDFVFNKEDVVRKVLVSRIEAVERSIKALTYLVNKKLNKG